MKNLTTDRHCEDPERSRRRRSNLIHERDCHAPSGLAMTRWFVILLFTFYFLLVTSPVHAAVNLGDKYAFGDITTLGGGVNRLVRPTFSIATAVVVIYFLVGAYKYLTSAGDKEAVAGARGMITHAIIGFMILIFAFLVLQFGLSSLFGIEGLQIFSTQEGIP